MTEELEALRREIATKHKVLVGTDDPILMLVTANAFCMQRAIDQLEAFHTRALAHHGQQLELAAQRWLTAGQTASKQAMEQSTAAIQAAAATAAADARSSVEESASSLVGALRVAIALSLCGTVCSLVACALLWLR